MNAFKKNSDKLSVSLIMVITFICMFLFYTVAHPLYIYDMDDWAYVTSVRHALPSVSQWNPTKVLPETLMPLVSYIGAFVLYPFSGDYIQALCYAFAIFVSIFISLYMGIIAIVIKREHNISNKALSMLMILFLLLHFYAYLTQDTNNPYVLYGGNVTCIFNYLISALWNFILCCYFVVQKRRCWSDRNNYVRKGVLVLAVYLAVNSNLWHSIILMSYLGIELLFRLMEVLIFDPKVRKNSISWKLKVSNLLKEELPKIGALIIWFVSMIFEINGGRAKWNVPGKLQLKEALKAFAESISLINRGFLILVVIINILSVIAAYSHLMKDSHAKDSCSKSFLYTQGKRCAVMILSIIYLLLLAAKVSAHYLRNPNVMISWMLWLLLISISSIAYLVKTEPRFVWLLPLAIYILIFEVVITKKTFAENYASSQVPSVIKALDDDIIDQVKTAENAGETFVTVYFPVTDTSDWPRKPSAMAHRISEALYYHGVTETYVEIEIVTDESKDLEFHLK